MEYGSATGSTSPKMVRRDAPRGTEKKRIAYG